MILSRGIVDEGQTRPRTPLPLLTFLSGLIRFLCSKVIRLPFPLSVVILANTPPRRCFVPPPVFSYLAT